MIRSYSATFIPSQAVPSREDGRSAALPTIAICLIYASLSAAPIRTAPGLTPGKIAICSISAQKPEGVGGEEIFKADTKESRETFCYLETGQSHRWIRHQETIFRGGWSQGITSLKESRSQVKKQRVLSFSRSNSLHHRSLWFNTSSNVCKTYTYSRSTSPFIAIYSFI